MLRCGFNSATRVLVVRLHDAHMHVARQLRTLAQFVFDLPPSHHTMGKRTAHPSAAKTKAAPRVRGSKSQRLSNQSVLDALTRSGIIPSSPSVGDGTPAAVAGVMVGDLILSVDEEPITSADDFEDYLENRTKPGSLVKITVKRNGTEKQFEIGLTEKPIQVIRPEPGLVDDQYDFPESFILSLVKPMAIDEAWPELDGDMRDANWEVSKLTENLVELKFELSEAKLNELGFQGPITVFKRYKMPEVPVDAPADLTSRTFHLNLEVEIKNGSNQAQQLAYKMDGPTGLTAETWWYANKIHGRQTAIGYIAGARDVVGANGVVVGGIART